MKTDQFTAYGFLVAIPESNYANENLPKRKFFAVLRAALARCCSSDFMLILIESSGT
jgi:hypothetical protein